MEVKPLVLALLALGCTELAPETDHCYDVGLCEQRWACGGQSGPAVTRSADLEPFVLPVLEWGSTAPLAGRGLTVEACATVPARCDPLAAAAAPDAYNGAAALALPEGFDGFLRLTVAESAPDADGPFVPLSFYPHAGPQGELTVSPTAVLMIRQGILASVASDAFGSVGSGALDPSRGIVVLAAYDCAGARAPDVRLELDRADGAVPFRLNAQRRPVVGEAVTDDFGVAGWANVAPGSLVVTAFHGDSPEPYATATIGLVAGEITAAEVAPAAMATAP